MSVAISFCQHRVSTLLPVKSIATLTIRSFSGKVLGLRGVEQRQLVGLITRRSAVRIRPPQPICRSSTPPGRASGGVLIPRPNHFLTTGDRLPTSRPHSDGVSPLLGALPAKSRRELSAT